MARVGCKAYLALCFAGALAVSGCGSGGEVATVTAESRFESAKNLFDDGAYLEAINEFSVITLQYQGSPFAADAQFYLGESRFQREEYLLAAFEYNVLRRNYPASARVADGLYKLGLSYYELSPSPKLDQRYTRKAIDEFQTFVEYYPLHELAIDAEEKIAELNARLARKAYDTARLYVRMGYLRAALIAFEVVIEKYHDTEYSPQAYLGKAEVLVERGRYEEARSVVETFVKRYPDDDLRSWIDQLKQEIDEVLLERSPSSSDEASRSQFGTGGPADSRPAATRG
ncbi:MAG: outer membrane protein assembly factor BamD [Bacteroidota bacterium]